MFISLAIWNEKIINDHHHPNKIRRSANFTVHNPKKTHDAPTEPKAKLKLKVDRKKGGNIQWNFKLKLNPLVLYAVGFGVQVRWNQAPIGVHVSNVNASELKLIILYFFLDSSFDRSFFRWFHWLRNKLFRSAWPLWCHQPTGLKNPVDKRKQAASKVQISALKIHLQQQRNCAIVFCSKYPSSWRTWQEWWKINFLALHNGLDNHSVSTSTIWL